MQFPNINHSRYLWLSIYFILFTPFIGCRKEPSAPESNTFRDIDGNTYQTIEIGSQVWMAENLRTTHYRNGDPIPNVAVDSLWNGKNGVCCSYENSMENIPVYGLLYNWFAVNDSRKIAPQGWHIPSIEEWKQLIDFLGGDTLAGGKLKERGTNHWSSPNTGANDQAGFKALPGGWRWGHGPFLEKGTCAVWWSSSNWDKEPEFTYATGVYNDNSKVVWGYLRQKTSGFSVRCVKD